MSALLTMATEHLTHLVRLAADGGGDHGARGSGSPRVVPNPAPVPPPGVSANLYVILAWAKWGVIICGIAGLLMCAGKMAIGHRNRATLAADGATGIPWVLGGLSLAAVSSGIVEMFLS